jgi:hypothetical protein
MEYSTSVLGRRPLLDGRFYFATFRRFAEFGHARLLTGVGLDWHINAPIHPDEGVK